MTLERKTILHKESIQDIVYGLSFKDGIKELKKYLKEHYADENKVKFSIIGEYSSCELGMVWESPESDEQYNRRVKEYEQAKEARKKKYEELRREFESQEQLTASDFI